MAGSSTKSNGVDTESIKNTALKDLLDVVDSVRGKKALVLDPTLTGPVGLVVKFSLLRDHGIDKVYHLEPSPLAVTHDKIIYFVRPLQRNAEMIRGMAYDRVCLMLRKQIKSVISRPSLPSANGSSMFILCRGRPLLALISWKREGYLETSCWESCRCCSFHLSMTCSPSSWKTLSKSCILYHLVYNWAHNQGRRSLQYNFFRSSLNATSKHIRPFPKIDRQG